MYVLTVARGVLRGWVKKVKGLRSIDQALTGVAHLVGYHPSRQKVAGSIPSQGTHPGFESDPWLEA